MRAKNWERKWSISRRMEAPTRPVHPREHCLAEKRDAARIRATKRTSLENTGRGGGGGQRPVRRLSDPSVRANCRSRRARRGGQGGGRREPRQGETGGDRRRGDGRVAEFGEDDGPKALGMCKNDRIVHLHVPLFWYVSDITKTRNYAQNQ